MSWFRVDDKAAFHRKVLRAGNEAFGAFCRAGSVSSGEGTDGRITVETCEAIAPKKVWDKLIAAGLAERIEGSTDLQLHDYLQWNPSAAEVEEAKEAKRKSGAKGGQAKAFNRSKGLASATCQPGEALADARAPATADDVATGLVKPSINLSPPNLLEREREQQLGSATPADVPEAPRQDPSGSPTSTRFESGPTRAIRLKLESCRTLRGIATVEFAERWAAQCREGGHVGKHSLATILECIEQVDLKAQDHEAAGCPKSNGELVNMVRGFINQGSRPAPAATPEAPPEPAEDPRLERDPETGRRIWDYAKHGPPPPGVFCAIRNAPPPRKAWADVEPKQA